MSIQVTCDRIAVDTPSNRELAELFLADLVEHLTGWSDKFQDAELVFGIERIHASNISASLQVDLSGRIDGRDFSTKVTTRRMPVSWQIVSGFGGLLGPWFVALVSRCCGASGDRTQLQACVALCREELRGAVGDIVAPRATDYGHTWNSFCRSRWTVALLCFVTPVMLSFLPWLPPGTTMRAAFAGLVWGAIAWLLVHLFGLAFMPEAFFREDAHGREEMRRCGVSTVSSLQFLSSILGLLLVGGLVLFTMFVYGDFLRIVP